jgi:hypothetical protein
MGETDKTLAYNVGAFVQSMQKSADVAKDAAGPVTVQRDFLNATPQGDKLFSVRGGVPLGGALDQLGIMIASAISAIEGTETAGEASSPNGCAAALQLLNLSYELVQSMHDGILRSKA